MFDQRQKAVSVKKNVIRNITNYKMEKWGSGLIESNNNPTC